MNHTYWADLHNHNEIGYGRGSLERSYRIAQETLDVYALSTQGLWPMLAHSRGGDSASQCGMETLRRGKRFGFTAGTDTHFGRPGCHGEGLTAVLAGKLTRADILSALRQRHTYAVTGDRIGMSV